MRLETALLTGTSGVTSYGQAIAVTGDNIANVNTDGYKGSRTEFSDLLAAGINGDCNEVTAQSGCGVYVSAVTQVFDQGTIEFTGRTLDCGIEGNGFFIVQNGTEQLYTRVGNFSVNSDGYLVTGDGHTVLGYAEGSTTLSPLSLQNIELTGSATSSLDLSGNLNASQEITTLPTNPNSFIDVNKNSTYTTNIDVYDSLGESHSIMLAYFKTGTNTWVAQAYIDGEDVGQTAGTPVQIGANTTLSFGPDGAMTGTGTAITCNPSYSNGSASGNFSIDLSSFTQYASASGLASVTQDGKPAGNVEDYLIESNGDLYAKLDSGTYQLIGTIQLADVINKDGLERVGDNLYRATIDAGDVVIGSPGSSSFGELNGGAMERSNVDLSSEFVELVTLQRGYQANSQTLQVANELIRDTIQLMR